MVLVLAADMVRGVLHASRVRRARPQWTILVYTPPGAWPCSTWAPLVVMWHLAPEDAPTGTAEEIARDLHTWPAGEDYPWRRPRGGLPVAPAAEGLSLAATLRRHPDKRARHFLQTGTVPAAPPDSQWRLEETFIVISTLCVCCASPAACCWCRVSCCLFMMTKYNQSRITQARDKQVEENQDQSMKGCSVNSERCMNNHRNCNSGQIGLHIHKDS